MIPTLLIGDHLLVAKSAYDLSLPFVKKSLLRVSDPEAGDVVVFEYPNAEKEKRKAGLSYIKRVIGVPGDVIKLSKGVLYINNAPVSQEKIDRDDVAAQHIPNFKVFPHAALYREELGVGQAHWIQKYPASFEKFLDDFPRFKSNVSTGCLEIGAYIVDPKLSFYRSIAANEVCEFIVPAAKYFMMGDNRDDSEDGRFWGFVDRDKIKGKALMIFMALNRAGFAETSKNPALGPEASYFNWKRVGLKIK